MLQKKIVKTSFANPGRDYWADLFQKRICVVSIKMWWIHLYKNMIDAFLRFTNTTLMVNLFVKLNSQALEHYLALEGKKMKMNYILTSLTIIFLQLDISTMLLVENIQNFGSRILTFNRLTIFLNKFFITLKTAQKFQ